MDRCVLCGRHVLTYINCDEWACPFLTLKAGEMPDTDEDEDEDIEEERIEIDDDDDEIGGPWDEMSQWDLEEDEDDEEAEES